MLRSDPRLGCVVPKRLARRAVTRVLVKRLARQAATHTQAQWPQPLWWVVRLTAPIRPEDFRSASSDRLRSQLRVELDRVFSQALTAWRQHQADTTPLPAAAQGGGAR